MTTNEINLPLHFIKLIQIKTVKMHASIKLL